MKQLIIAEKPSVARDLARVLGATQKTKTYIEGKNVIVTWALGHLLGLKMPEDYQKNWEEWKLETLPMIPRKVEIKPLPKTGGQLKAIRQLANRKDVGEAVIATDAGREGELVARWILEYVRFSKPVKRLWISSQTDKAIKTGFKQLKPSREYDNLYQSALARAKADWLVGLNVTRALTVKYRDSLAAGRVQTPTLAMVRGQEKKIESFRPETYFSINMLYKKETGRLNLKNPRQYKERSEVEELLKELKSLPAKVVAKSEKKRTEAAPLPYDLTEIQREANQRYQFSAKKTLALVQSLYEKHKVVTYPRTDSEYLTTDMQSTMKERLQALSPYYGEAKAYLKTGGKVKQTKVFQDGKVTDHHALIPTEQAPRFEKMENDEQKIYQLIVKRFLNLFGEAYREIQETIEVQMGNHVFLFTQTKVVENGWKRSEDRSLPENNSTVNWQIGMSVAGTFTAQKELTTPPAPLNEASLLGKMEKYGLGTPATRAEIIEKLIKSELMERNQSKLLVTPKGKQLLQLVNPTLVTPDLTAKWETELEEIAKGKRKNQVFMAEIEKETKKLVQEIKQSKQTYQDFSITQKKCPECGNSLKEKNSRDGKLYICSSTDCHYRRRKEPKVSNHRCSQCHRKMEIHEGKNGAYFKCKFCNITEKMATKTEKKKKMTKHEERKLIKQYSKPQEVEESPMAKALRAAMESKK